MNVEIQQRVFIVGAPRSGTTLLQSFLASHPRIQSFPETHFFSAAFPRLCIKRMLTWSALNVRGVLKRFLHEINRPDLIEEYGHINLLEHNYANTLIRLLDHLTLEAGKDIWVEKTPRHIFFVEEISNRVPKAKFIHIIRHGADVVASLYEVTNRDFFKWRKGKQHLFAKGLSIDKCIKRWNDAVQITAKWYRCSNHLLVKYEQLVKSPPEELDKICNFLEINYSPLMERGERSFDEIVTLEEKWKANNMKPVQEMDRKFFRIFSEEEQKYILGKLHKINF